MYEISVPKIDIPTADDLYTQRANALAFKKAKLQSEEDDRAISERNVLNSLYSKRLGANGLDRQGFLSDVAASPLAYKTPDFQKMFAEQDKEKLGLTNTQSEIDKRNAEVKELQSKLLAKGLENTKYASSFLKTPDDVIAWINGVAQDDVVGPYYAQYGVTPEKVTAQLAQMKDQASFDQFLKNIQLGTDGALKHFQKEREIVQKGNEHNLNVAKHVAQTQQSAATLKQDQAQHEDTIALGRDQLKETTRRHNLDHQDRLARLALDTEKFAAEKLAKDTEKTTAYARSFQTQMGKDDATRLATSRVKAENADEAIRDAREALSILDSGKVITGFAAEQQLNGLRAINADGRHTPTISNSERLNAIVKTAALHVLDETELKGPTSDKDIELIKDIVGGGIYRNEATLRQAMQAIERKALQRKNRYNSERSAFEARMGVGGQPAATSKAAVPSTLKVGDVVGGLKYKGGDPKKQTSWEKAR